MNVTATSRKVSGKMWIQTSVKSNSRENSGQLFEEKTRSGKFTTDWENRRYLTHVRRDREQNDSIYGRMWKKVSVVERLQSTQKRPSTLTVDGRRRHLGYHAWMTTADAFSIRRPTCTLYCVSNAVNTRPNLLQPIAARAASTITPCIQYDV